MPQEKTPARRSGQTQADLSADPRAIQTRAALRQALMCLLEQGDWGRINVAGICRQAHVARSSFYEHYRTKSDLLDEIFATSMAAVRPQAGRQGPLAVLDWLIQHVAASPGLFADAMEGRRGDALLPRFRRALIRQLSQELDARGIPDARLTAAHIIGGAMACLAAPDLGATPAILQDMAARVIRPNGPALTPRPAPCAMAP